MHPNDQGMPLYRAPGWVYSPVAPTDFAMRLTHLPTYGSEGKPQSVFRSQVRVKWADTPDYVRWWLGNFCCARLGDNDVGPAAFEIRVWRNFPHLAMLLTDEWLLSSRQKRWSTLRIETGVAAGVYRRQVVCITEFVAKNNSW